MPHLLLAVDTSGKNGSIALAHARPGRSEIEVCKVVPLAGGAFSSQLVPEIAALLKKYEHSKTDIGGFAVVSGPGSFTGLRVGLAAVKALSEALQKPIAAISSLEALAWQTKKNVAPGATGGRVLAVLDAGRGDVYVGDYELQPPPGASIRRYSERLLNRIEFEAELNSPEATGKVVVTPDPALADTISALIRVDGIAPTARVDLIPYPDGAAIAHLGWEHLQRGQTVRSEELEANYLRHSDAEIFAKPKA